MDIGNSLASKRHSANARAVPNARMPICASSLQSSAPHSMPHGNIGNWLSPYCLYSWASSSQDAGHPKGHWKKRQTVRYCRQYRSQPLLPAQTCSCRTWYCKSTASYSRSCMCRRCHKATMPASDALVTSAALQGTRPHVPRAKPIRKVMLTSPTLRALPAYRSMQAPRFS